jgi:hypothetical protein
MNDTVKAGVRTSEFYIVVAFGFFVLLTGLTVTDGSVSYALAGDMKELLGWVVTTYVGARGAIKVAEVVKKPAAEQQPPAPPPSVEEVAVKVLEKLQNHTKGATL